jgi:hypothetical protein
MSANGDDSMTGYGRFLAIAGAAIVVAVTVPGFAETAQAVERFAINVVNERDFKLTIRLRDKMCGGDVVLQDQLEAGESREIEICANTDGVGGLRASYGSGCGQVKRTEFLDIAPGDSITF